MAEIGSLVVSLQARTDTLERQLKRANGFIRKLQKEVGGIAPVADRAEKRTTRAFTRMSAGARGLSTSIVTLTRGMKTLAVVGGAFLAGAFVTRTIAATDELGKFASRVGVSVEGLQELEFAASQTGVPLTVFRLGIQRILRRAQDAVRGNKELTKSFGEVGLSLRDLQTLSNEQIFRQAISGAARLETGLAAIQKIADTEGVALINLGRRGAQGISRLQQSARDLGIVLDASIVKQAEMANDQLDILRRVIGVQLAAAALKVVPLITSLGQSFARMVKALVAGGPALDALTSREAALVQFFSGFGRLVKEVSGGITKLIELTVNLSRGIGGMLKRLKDEIALRRDLADIQLLENVRNPTALQKRRLEELRWWQNVRGRITSTTEVMKENITVQKQLGAVSGKLPQLAPIAQRRPVSEFRTESGKIQEFGDGTLSEFTRSTGSAEQAVVSLTAKLRAQRIAMDKADESTVTLQSTMESTSNTVLSELVGAFTQAGASAEEMVSRIITAISSTLLSSSISQLSSQIGGLFNFGAAAGGASSPLTTPFSPATVPLAAGANGMVVNRPTMALLGERSANNPEIVLNRQQFSAMQSAAPQVTVITVDSRHEAERLAALETLAGKTVTIQDLVRDINQGDGSPVVQAMRRTLGR